MGRHPFKLLIALALAAFGIFDVVSGGAIEHAPGVLIPTAPLQRLLSQQARIPVGEFELEPQAEFYVHARVLAVRAYRRDSGADLSPLDIAVGWGPMSDSAVLEHFRITQGGRFFTIYPDAQAIDLNTALLSTANLHLIPASPDVRRRLARIRIGQVVHLRGRLVNVHGPNGYKWRTSLSRTDTGEGACELLYVERVQLAVAGG